MKITLAAIGLAIAIVIVFILLAMEIRRRALGTTPLPRRRFVLRIIAGLVMAALLGAILVGITILHLSQPDARPRLFIVYWLACFAVALVLIILALAEMRQIRVVQEKREQELWRDMAQFMVKQIKGKKD